MLRATPNGWFSYDFTLSDRTGAPVARVDLSNWRETAKIEAGGARFEASHKSMAGEFFLRDEGGRQVAVAEKPSAWKDRFSFEHGANRYELKKESVWRRTFVLTREGVGKVGQVRPTGWFGRNLVVELPGELPPEIGAFVVWLAVVLRKREDSAAASTGAAGAAGG